MNDGILIHHLHLKNVPYHENFLPYPMDDRGRSVHQFALPGTMHNPGSDS